MTRTCVRVCFVRVSRVTTSRHVNGRNRVVLRAFTTNEICKNTRFNAMKTCGKKSTRNLIIDAERKRVSLVFRCTRKRSVVDRKRPIRTERRKKPIRSLHFKMANTVCAVQIRVRRRLSDYCHELTYALS